MTEKQERAIDLFKNGYNCAQSVLSVLSPELGLNQDIAMKLASPFGSGIAYMQETCGAVTGALMAIGLKYGKGENGTTEDKERAYDFSRHFLTEFKQERGSICCRTLMEGLDMSTPEGMAEIGKRKLFQLKCAHHVQTAITIAQKIVREQQ
jgi:C_GCAxxG_C_C family probable redox protein